MNKAAIKAELRRSACEDERPWDGVRGFAHAEACGWKIADENMLFLSNDSLRIFFLLVAEAL